MHFSIIAQTDALFLPIITRETLVRRQLYLFTCHDRIGTTYLHVIQEDAEADMHICKSQALSRAKHIVNLLASQEISYATSINPPLQQDNIRMLSSFMHLLLHSSMANFCQLMLTFSSSLAKPSALP